VISTTLVVAVKLLGQPMFGGNHLRTLYIMTPATDVVAIVNQSINQLIFIWICIIT